MLNQPILTQNPFRGAPEDYKCYTCRGTGNIRLAGDSAPGLLYRFKMSECPTCLGRRVNAIPIPELSGRIVG